MALNPFETTQWSIVVRAGADSTEESQRALTSLCETYWPPLYSYVRRRGNSHDDARDLTQEFFARFIEKNYSDDVEREKGKFRSFLLASLDHFLANEYDKTRAQKPGSGQRPFSLDFALAENKRLVELSGELTPEKAFERQWALSLSHKVMGRLRREYEADGKLELYDGLKVFLTGERGEIPYAKLARELRYSEGAIRVAVHRMRRRYRALFTDEVTQTVASPELVDQELRDLMAAIQA